MSKTTFTVIIYEDDYDDEKINKTLPAKRERHRATTYIEVEDIKKMNDTQFRKSLWSAAEEAIDPDHITDGSLVSLIIDSEQKGDLCEGEDDVSVEKLIFGEKNAASSDSASATSTTSHSAEDVNIKLCLETGYNFTFEEKVKYLKSIGIEC